MNVRRNIAAVVFGLSFAATPVFAAAPTPAPKPDQTQPVKQIKVTKESKGAKPMKVNRLHHAPVVKAAPAATPTPAK